jgi:transposase
MDVHLAVIHVCVILQEAGCEPEVHRRQFGAFQRDRRAMAEWIAGFAPDIVVMESTGIYWKSPYALWRRPASGHGWSMPNTSRRCLAARP